eukprot:7199699-Pyramimonas_sp.AAC.1
MGGAGSFDGFAVDFAAAGFFWAAFAATLIAFGAGPPRAAGRLRTASSSSASGGSAAAAGRRSAAR